MLIKNYFLSLVGVLILFLLPVYVQAQEIRFSEDKLTIEEAFKEIERQTDYLISYSAKDFNLNNYVVLTAQQLPIEEALTQILNHTGHIYTMDRNYILIIPEITQKVEPETPKKLENISIIDLEKLQKDINSYKQEYLEEIPNEPFFDIEKYQTQREYHEFINGKPAYVDKLPKVAVRTNLLYGLGALTPNGGIEIGLNPRSTLLVNGSYNGWKVNNADNKKLWHWSVGTEYRYWFCERFNGHFLGAHGFYGNYNISGKKYRWYWKKTLKTTVMTVTD